MGIFPFGITHIESQTNLNGFQSQTTLAIALLTVGQPKDASLKQTWTVACTVATLRGPRKSCGTAGPKTEPDFNRQRRTFPANFRHAPGRFAYSVTDNYYGQYRPGPNPPGAPYGFHLATVYSYPWICYYAGTKKKPINRCSYALSEFRSLSAVAVSHELDLPNA
ncbi:MAG: hypothetical protein M3Y09_17760 [Actinomycetota bacterium]|nr:hypothetical protein [Actinomycetota bacterium]